MNDDEFHHPRTEEGPKSKSVVSKDFTLTLTTCLQAVRAQFNTDRTPSPSGSPSASGWLWIVPTGRRDAVGGGQTAR